MRQIPEVHRELREELVLKCLPSVVLLNDWSICLWGNLALNSGDRPIHEPVRKSRAAAISCIGSNRTPGCNRNRKLKSEMTTSNSTFSLAGRQLLEAGLCNRQRQKRDGHSDGVGTPYLWTLTVPTSKQEKPLPKWEGAYRFLTYLFRVHLELPPRLRAAAVKLCNGANHDGKIPLENAHTVLGMSTQQRCLPKIDELVEDKRLPVRLQNEIIQLT